MALPALVGRGNVTLKAEQRFDAKLGTRLLKLYMARHVTSTMFRQRHSFHTKRCTTLNMFFRQTITISI